MIRSLLLLAGVIGGVAAATGAVNATSSQLTQRIVPTDCILTLIATENGQQTIGACPTEAPVVTSIETTTAGQRMVRGLFNSSQTALLKVTFRGVEYTAGAPGSPLTVVGDSWTFSIDEASPGAPSGNYLIKVNAILTDGRSLSVNADVTLPSEESVNPDMGFDTQQPNVRVFEPMAEPEHLTDSFSLVDVIDGALYRPALLVDDKIGQPLMASVLTEYVKSAVVIAVIGIIIFGNYLFAFIRNFIRNLLQ